jgi:hypothetical protein
LSIGPIFLPHLYFYRAVALKRRAIALLAAALDYTICKTCLQYPLQKNHRRRACLFRKAPGRHHFFAFLLIFFCEIALVKAESVWYNKLDNYLIL